MEAAFNDEDESSIYVRGLGGYQRLEPGSWNGGRGQVDSSKLLAPRQRPLVRLRIGSAGILSCLMCWHRRLLCRQVGLHARRSAIRNKQRTQEVWHLLPDATLRAKPGARSVVRIDKVRHLLPSSICREWEARCVFKVTDGAKYVVQLRGSGLSASLVHVTRLCMRSQHTAFQLAETAHVLTPGSMLWGLRLNAFLGRTASLRIYQSLLVPLPRPQGGTMTPLAIFVRPVVRPAKASTFVICLKHHQRSGNADRASTSKTAQRPPRTTDMQA